MSRYPTALFISYHKAGNVHLCATVAQPEVHLDLDRLLNCQQCRLVYCDENARMPTAGEDARSEYLFIADEVLPRYVC